MTRKSKWYTKKSIRLAIASFLFGSFLFLVAYLGMIQGVGLGKFNQPILSWIVDNRNTGVTTTMKVLTSIGSPIVVACIIGLVAAIWGIVKREIWRPVLLIIFVIDTAIISAVIKMWVANLRPPQIDMIAPFETDFSFPSGHTIVVVVSMLLIGYLICSRRSTRKRIAIWASITTTGVLLVAFSRLYLGYHWLTDVMASIGLGFMIFSMAVTIDVLFRLNKEKLQ